MDDGYDAPKTTAVGDPGECIIDMREYDVPYHVRVAIDKGTTFRLDESFFQMLTLNFYRYTNRKMVYR